MNTNSTLHDETTASAPREEVAIVGMAGRLPGASNLREFWQNLVDGKESIQEVTAEMLSRSGLDPALLSEANYVARAALLSDADCFDAGFFGYTPKEASLMDPQHRQLLETAWEALEHAGYDPRAVPGVVGVIAGVAYNSYLQNNLAPHPSVRPQLGQYGLTLGNEKDFAATRIAYKLNLKGPSFTLQTACSSSLVGVHLACQSLLAGESDVMLVGGGRIRVPLEAGYRYQEGGIPSPDGRCRAFDAETRGCVVGSGVAVVVLKRLSDALKDGDRIWSVIRGTAINNDGQDKIGFTAPSVSGQAAVIAQAQAMAEVDARSIDYVEAHGTGTSLGDPIEIAGLTKAFRESTQENQFCAIGSVKTNIGHLDAGAGLAGLIKATLALAHEKIPPSLHFNTPNPQIDWARSPFFVNSKLRPWPHDPARPRRAAVSSFGIGGTNAHVVLEEAPASRALKRDTKGRSSYVTLRWTARTPEQGTELGKRLIQYLGDHPGADLDAVASTLLRSRMGHSSRAALVVNRSGESCAFSRLCAPSGNEQGSSGVVFLFPGQGAQRLQMGRDLYESEPIFRSAVDQCVEIVQTATGMDLKTLLYPEKEFSESASQRLLQTRWTQPALFAVEYALAQLWMHQGVKPVAVAGHSVGEYVALVIAEVLTLEQGLKLLVKRAELMQAMPAGRMLAVRLSAEAVKTYLTGSLGLAALNGPELTVVSGGSEEVTALEAQLTQRGIGAKILATSHAFHSTTVETLKKEFVAAVEQTQRQAPKIPCASNLTGAWITAEQVADATNFYLQARQPVQWISNLKTLATLGSLHFLEVGPGQALQSFARACPESAEVARLIGGSLSQKEVSGADAMGFWETAAALWVEGVEIRYPKSMLPTSALAVPLPSYPFLKERYWIDVCSESSVESPTEAESAQTGVPSVESAGEEEAEPIAPQVYRVFTDLSGVALDEKSGQATFMSLGFDSLFLTQANQALESRFGVKVGFRRLMEDLVSPSRVSEFIAANAQPVKRTPAATPKSTRRAGTTAGSASTEVMDRLLEELLHVSRKIDALTPGAIHSASTPKSEGAPSLPAAAPASGAFFGPFRGLDASADRGGLSLRGVGMLEEFTKEYCSRMRRSKQWVSEHREFLADPRSLLGFKRAWKELVFPIVVEKSQGSKLWDIDGNCYTDFTMGFGVNLFGHNPEFVRNALRDQLDRGVEIGPQTPLAGEVARLAAEMTGHARVAFTNTGSEAVLAALRLARTVTARNKVVIFAGSYHGIFDEVLGRPMRLDGSNPIPIAPGILPSMMENVAILEYGAPASLDYIRAHGSELAAVLVEPVQSRHPELQPREFLHALREVTTQHGVAMILDEMVTGFRCHPRGAQGLFGIQADIATYGKVVGGGLPLGMIAGSERFMDALDGGAWNYGDESFPQVGVTFFAGTFVRHPLALAAARAVLQHLKRHGNSLQENLSRRTAGFVAELQRLATESGLPIQVRHFASLFHIQLDPRWAVGNLLYPQMRFRGIHVLEGRAGFVSTAHTDQELTEFVEAFGQALRTLIALSAGPGQAQAEPSNLGNVTPLTDAQQEVWLAAQLGGEASPAFNDGAFLRLARGVQETVLVAAWGKLVERHESLRTQFSSDGQSQRVLSAVDVSLPIEDWISLSSIEREVRWTELYRSLMEEEFDLTRAPLWRARLIRWSDDELRIILVAHHLIVDGWSWGVLLREWGQTYRDLLKVSSCQRAEPVLTFSRYVGELGSAEHRRACDRAGAFWKKFLEGVPTPPALPSGQLTPDSGSHRCDQVMVTMAADRWGQIRSAAASLGLTPFTLLFGSFHAWIARITDQKDFVIGVPSAGQLQVGHLSGASNLVGHCVQLLPIRLISEPQHSFLDHSAAVKSAVLDCFEHAQLTYGKILQHLGVTRRGETAPLLNVMFNLESPGSPSAAWEPVKVQAEPLPKPFTFFDLFVNAVDHGKEGLEVEFRFRSARFPKEQVTRWVSQWLRFLESAGSQPGVPMRQLSMTPQADVEQIALWNQTEVPGPSELNLWTAIEAQMQSKPEAIALISGGESWTYQKLQHEVEQLAFELQERGIGCGNLVGICSRRSPKLLVGLLAVLRCGAGYLPLDPTYPADRLRYILGDAHASLLLVEDDLASLFSDATPRHSLTGSSAAIAAGTSLLACPAQPRDLAYVMYTSGSTGLPKGVAIEHRNVLNLVRWALRTFQVSHLEGMLWSTSVCFDLSVFEIFVTLCGGHRLILAENALALPQLPSAGEVTFINTVPSAIAELMRRNEIPSTVKTVLLCGEFLKQSLVEELQNALPHVVILDYYGPTETTVYATGGLREAGGRPSIGRPLSNTRIHLLDDSLTPVPIGATGEIFIAGEGVGRGYWNRPELTAERFPTLELPGITGERAYRTGDLARYRSDGCLEFLGRRDHQVKLRGFRIELEEIDSQLLSTGRVLEAVTIVAADPDRLVSYVTPKNGLSGRPLEQELKKALRGKLPDYMVPAQMVTLPSLPLTPNGKIDRKALPLPESLDAGSASAEAVDPAVAIPNSGAELTDVEKLLLEIWQSLLHRGQIGRDDNFFELGGHSLLMTQAVSRIREVFELEFSMRAFFQNPTLAGQAAEIKALLDRVDPLDTERTLGNESTPVK